MPVRSRARASPVRAGRAGARLRLRRARRGGVPLDPVADLKRRLARAATWRARAFWTRYLRGAAKFRGVRMADVRSVVHGWWAEHGFAAHPAVVGKRVALALIEQPMTEDKLAGILVLQELLGEQLRVTDLGAFARLFAAGHLADWNVVDWFAVKVLVTLIERAPGRGPRRDVERVAAARAVAQWRGGETTWQRRAACVAFAKLAPAGEAGLPGLTGLALELCGVVVWSRERFDQTAVGWLLRELSRVEPARVEAFFRRHARLMSKECARTAVSKLAPGQRAELLAHHRRATTLRLS